MSNRTFGIIKSEWWYTIFADKDLSKEAMLAYLFINSSEQANGLGCFRVYVHTIAAETRMGQDEAEAAVAELLAKGLIQRDGREWTYVTDFITDHPIQSASNLIHARDEMKAKFPEAFKTDLAVKILATTNPSAWLPPPKSTIKEPDLTAFHKSLQDLAGHPPSTGGLSPVTPPSTTGRPRREEEEQEGEHSDTDSEREVEGENAAMAAISFTPSIPSPVPSLPSDKSVGQSGVSLPIPSEKPSPADPVSRAEWVQKFSDVDVDQFTNDPGQGLANRWYMMCMLVGSPKVQPVTWSDNPAYAVAFNNLVRTDPYSLIKFQASMWWIPRDTKLHGIDSSKPDGGFAADFYKMLAPLHNSTIHEWAHKWLHQISPVKPEHKGCIGTVFWDGKAQLIGIDAGLDVPFLIDEQGVKTVLKDWKWGYPREKPKAKK